MERFFLIVMTLFTALVSFSKPARAEGGYPSLPGIDYLGDATIDGVKTVTLRLQRDAVRYPTAEELAKAYGTNVSSIRELNMTVTLARCRTDRGWTRTLVNPHAPPPSTAEQIWASRKADGLWNGCPGDPKAQQLVLIQGEKLVIHPGQTARTSTDILNVGNAFLACKDEACVKTLAANNGLHLANNGGSVAQAPTPLSSGPTPTAPPKVEVPVAPQAPTSLPTDVAQINDLKAELAKLEKELSDARSNATTLQQKLDAANAANAALKSTSPTSPAAAKPMAPTNAAEVAALKAQINHLRSQAHQSNILFWMVMALLVAMLVVLIASISKNLQVDERVNAKNKEWGDHVTGLEERQALEMQAANQKHAEELKAAHQRAGEAEAKLLTMIGNLREEVKDLRLALEEEGRKLLEEKSQHQTTLEALQAEEQTLRTAQGRIEELWNDARDLVLEFCTRLGINPPVLRTEDSPAELASEYLIESLESTQYSMMSAFARVHRLITTDEYPEAKFAMDLGPLYASSKLLEKALEKLAQICEKENSTLMECVEAVEAGVQAATSRANHTAQEAMRRAEVLIGEAATHRSELKEARSELEGLDTAYQQLAARYESLKTTAALHGADLGAFEQTSNSDADLPVVRHTRVKTLVPGHFQSAPPPANGPHDPEVMIHSNDEDRKNLLTLLKDLPENWNNKPVEIKTPFEYTLMARFTEFWKGLPNLKVALIGESGDPEVRSFTELADQPALLARFASVH
jgi:hypothetical protein